MIVRRCLSPLCHIRADGAADKPLIDEAGIQLTEQDAPLRTSDDGDARDLIPQDEPAQTKIPDKVTLNRTDGVKEDIEITPKMMFCSDKGPPGGWYGPFGFLRLVAYFFVGVAFVGLFLLGAAFFNMTVISLLTRILLIPAALLAAAAAYSHEGLANQVSVVAKRNNEYSSLDDEFESQLKDLEDVASKLDDMVKSGQANLEKLTEVLEGIERVSDLTKVNTLVRSFTDAEMREFMATGTAVTKRLSNVSELKAFLEGCIAVLKHNIPSFDLKAFRRFGLRGGVGMTIVSFMVAAVNTENQEEQHCMVEMLFFILDPHGEGRKAKVSHELVKHLKKHSKWGSKKVIDAELDRLIKTVDPNDKRGRIAEENVKELATAVLCTVAEARTDSSNSLQFGDEASDDDD